MRVISIVLLMISLESCRNIPTLREPLERCGLFIERIDENSFYGKCRCHLYEITPDNIGRITESIDYSLDYCDRHVTFKASGAWTQLRVWFERLMIQYNQRKEQLKNRRN